MDIIKTDVHLKLSDMKENDLVLSYYILYGSFPSMNKEKLIKKLSKYFPYDLMLKHRDYFMALTQSQSISFEYYQGNGYVKVNNYLRYKNLTSWYDLNFDSKLVLSPSSFSKKNYRHLFNKTKQQQISNLKKGFKKTIQKNKMEFIKIKTTVSDIVNAIHHAPKLHKTFYVYRGEDNYDLSYVIEKNLNADEKASETYNISQLNLQKNDTYSSKGFNSFSIAPWVALKFSSQCCIYRIQMNDKIPYIIFPHSDSYKEYEVLLPPSVFKVVNVIDIVSPLSKLITRRMYDIEFVKTL